MFRRDRQSPLAPELNYCRDKQNHSTCGLAIGIQTRSMSADNRAGNYATMPIPDSVFSRTSPADWQIRFQEKFVRSSLHRFAAIDIMPTRTRSYTIHKGDAQQNDNRFCTVKSHRNGMVLQLQSRGTKKEAIAR
jgi:hypothetical protein